MPKRRTQGKLARNKKKTRASASSSESSSDSSGAESPRVSGVIAGHVPRRTSPERVRPPARGLEELLDALTLDPKRTRVIAPACSLPAHEEEEQGLMASGVLGVRRAAILSALAQPESNVRLLPPVALVGVVGPQPHPGETPAQFQRRLRAEAAERRRTDRGGAKKHSKKNRRR